jgi:hypothetical protein
MFAVSHGDVAEGGQEPSPVFACFLVAVRLFLCPRGNNPV